MHCQTKMYMFLYAYRIFKTRSICFICIFNVLYTYEMLNTYIKFCVHIASWSTVCCMFSANSYERFDIECLKMF